jgi:hypothetical protein
MRALRVLGCVILAALAAGCDDADTVPATPAPSPVASQVTLSTFPSYVLHSGSRATITARATSSTGTSLANVPVTFSTTAGTLSAASAVTSDAGTATVTLDAAEAAVVTAEAAGARRDVSLEGRAPYAIRLVAPSSVFTDGASFQVAVDPNINVADPPSPRELTINCGAGSTVTITDTRQHTCTFPSAGAYTVRANAVAANGWTLTETRAVDATARTGGTTETPPSTATPAVTVTAVRIGFREYRFTATATVPVERFVFDFGDKNTATRVAEGNRMNGTEQHLYSATSNSDPVPATGVTYTVRVTAPPVDRRPEVSAATTITLE